MLRIVWNTEMFKPEPWLFNISECILKETHMEQLDNKPTRNKVLNCVVQTSAKGISSMRIHTMVVLPSLCCVILEGYSDWSQRWLRTGHLVWMFYWWMFLYYLNLPARRRRFESLLVSDLAFIASGIFTGRSDIHISEQVWWQCLKIIHDPFGEKEINSVN